MRRTFGTPHGHDDILQHPVRLRMAVADLAAGDNVVSQ
jgi:hypothetical protein